MRRSDKEITDKAQIAEILQKAEVIRIAMVDDGEPYIVAMNFAYSGTDNCIYLHSAAKGRKIDILEKNSKVAFQTEIDAALVLREVACDSTVRYRSVCGVGRVNFVRDAEEKKKLLDAIMLKYSGRSGFTYSERALDGTLGMRLNIDSLTGKKSGY